MSVEYKIEEYKNYGKVVAITNGAADVKITIDVGPRIIYFALCGVENVMYNELDRDGATPDPRYEAAFGKGKVWQIYGGHRMWYSPEDFPLCYYPDQEPVKWEQQGDTFVFTPPMQRTTELQYVWHITLDKKKPILTVHHTLINHSGGPRTVSPWGLTVLAPGGLEIIPQPAEQYKLLSNRELVLWPYTNMADSRIYWGKDFITLRSVKDTAEGAFKLGLNNTAGIAAYVNNGTAFVKHYEHKMRGRYPDRGVSFETYTADKFLEMETLGELTEMMPGESCEHTETWKLFAAKTPLAKRETSLAALTKRIFK